MMKSAQFIPESYDVNVLSIFILYPNNMDKLNTNWKTVQTTKIAIRLIFSARGNVHTDKHLWLNWPLCPSAIDAADAKGQI